MANTKKGMLARVVGGFDTGINDAGNADLNLNLFQNPDPDTGGGGNPYPGGGATDESILPGGGGLGGGSGSGKTFPTQQEVWDMDCPTAEIEKQYWTDNAASYQSPYNVYAQWQLVLLWLTNKISTDCTVAPPPPTPEPPPVAPPTPEPPPVDPPMPEPPPVAPPPQNPPPADDVTPDVDDTDDTPPTDKIIAVMVPPILAGGGGGGGGVKKTTPMPNTKRKNYFWIAVGITSAVSLFFFNKNKNISGGAA